MPTITRVRFAPSPTGDLHIGGARTAIFCWLYARHYGGQFILRIEDTDQERSTPQAVQTILDGLDWLGLNYDEGPYFQSERTQLYRSVLEKLLSTGHAYHCSCTKERLEALRQSQISNNQKPRYDGHCRLRMDVHLSGEPTVVRFKSPEQGTVVVEDEVIGLVSFDNAELDDFILARSDGTPTYNFTAVVDDYELAITHVIRGNDHLNNTPRQINILKALNAPIPIYMHLPMIHSTQGKKLSKRDGAASIMDYRASGFLPDALTNYLARLGWSHGNQEVFSREALVSHFDGKHLSKSPSVLNQDKLRWLNQYYLKHTDPILVAKALKPFTQAWKQDHYVKADLSDIVIAQRDRVKTLKEMASRSQFFYAEPNNSIAPLPVTVLTALRDMRSHFSQLAQWEAKTIETVLQTMLQKYKLKAKELFQPLRMLLVGDTISPPMEVTIKLLGKQRTLARINKIVNNEGP